MPGLTPDLCAIHKLRMMRVKNTVHPNAESKAQAVLNFILESETLAGSQFMRAYGQLYMFMGHTRQILRVNYGRPDEDMAAYLEGLYGVSQANGVGKAVYTHLHSHILNNAIKTDLRRFAVFRTNTLTAYLSTYDGQMWRIDGGEPERVVNGEDDVFFVDDDGGTTVEPDIGPHGILLDRLINLNYTPGLGGMTAVQQRMLMTVWMFALAFPDRLPTKPLLMLEGTQGSGKSASLQLIQQALIGTSRPMILSKSKEDDFGVMLLRAPIAMFDNTDTYIDWVPDAICSYTTRGYWVKRKLFTDSDEAEIRPQSFVAVASKNPTSFRRTDTVDRQIIVRLDRLENFRPFEALEAEVLASRAQLVGEYIWYINEIVEQLRTSNGQPVQQEKTRMADFATFARAVAVVMGWSNDDVSAMFAALANEHAAFIAEDDPLLELLHKWIEYRGGGISAIGRKVTLFQLFNELKSRAEAEGIQFQFYKSSRMLAQNIRAQHVVRDFDIKISIENQQKVYQIWRKTDPKLEVVDGGLSYPTDTQDK